MTVVDKLLKWDELRVQLKAAVAAGKELACENADLRIANEMLRRENERLRDSAGSIPSVDYERKSGPDEAAEAGADGIVNSEVG